MLKQYPVILLLLLLTSCEDLSYDPPGGQPVYFEYEYINYAWGYQHNGWIIDSDGNVRAYNLPEIWLRPDSTGYISGADLENNVAMTDSVISVIGSDELRRHVKLISGAKDGFITKPEGQAFDAGSPTLYAYWYDPEIGAYRQVFLATSGDYSSENTSFEAKRLVRWLKDFGVFWL